MSDHILKNNNGSYIVSWDFSHGDTGVLIVGKQENGTVTIVNAFQGKDAYDIYSRLTAKKEGGVQ